MPAVAARGPQRNNGRVETPEPPLNNKSIIIMNSAEQEEEREQETRPGWCFLWAFAARQFLIKVPNIRNSDCETVLFLFLNESPPYLIEEIISMY